MDSHTHHIGMLFAYSGVHGTQLKYMCSSDVLICAQAILIFNMVNMMICNVTSQQQGSGINPVRFLSMVCMLSLYLCGFSPGFPPTAKSHDTKYF